MENPSFALTKLVQQTAMPRLFHINGNAIYNITHPWLRYLYGELEREAVAGTLRSLAAYAACQSGMTEEISSLETCRLGPV